jgi:hypothetical protein
VVYGLFNLTEKGPGPSSDKLGYVQ